MKQGNAGSSTMLSKTLRATLVAVALAAAIQQPGPAPKDPPRRPRAGCSRPKCRPGRPPGGQKRICAPSPGTRGDQPRDLADGARPRVEKRGAGRDTSSVTEGADWDRRGQPRGKEQATSLPPGTWRDSQEIRVFPLRHADSPAPRLAPESKPSVATPTQAERC